MDLKTALTRTLTYARLIERALYGHDLWSFYVQGLYVPARVEITETGVVFLALQPVHLLPGQVIVALTVNGDEVMYSTVAVASYDDLHDLSWVLNLDIYAVV